MIPESDKERLARAACDVATLGRMPDPDWQAFLPMIDAILTELTARGYVVAKLEGRVNEQKPPEDAA